MLQSHVAGKLGITKPELAGIKNIIFDLGGVIIEIRYQATIDAFNELGFQQFGELYAKMKQTPLFDLLETGKMPERVFRAELRKFLNHLTDEQIDNAWNTMIGHMPDIHLPLLKSVRQHYRTFLLSNTNSIHIRFFNQYLRQNFGSNALNEMFEKVYYSHELGLRKPHPEIFEAVLQDAGLKAEETLFIDDLLGNIEGARKAGLLAYHLDKETIRDLFIE